MTTAEIENFADLDGISTAELSGANLKFVLRHKVVYEFFHDAGYPAWTRRHVARPLAAAAQFVDIDNDDFRHMKKVALAPDYDTGLPYFGDDESWIMAAKANTTAGKPTGYMLEFDGSLFRRVFFNCPADTAYTVALVYDRMIPFPDDTSSVQLNPYIPADFQWGLVLGLRKQIYMTRFGIQDDRYMSAAQEYGEYIARIAESPNKSTGGRRSYVR
jgi:hypothetical protein